MQRLLFVLLGVLVALFATEAVLRFLPVSTATHTGYHLAPNILNYPPRHTWRMATGWDLRNVQNLRSNNMGFAAEHDFVPGSDAVALVGDSYVEASMLPLADRPAAQLERALGGGRQVYALGGPGSSLLDYAERVQWAYTTLGIRSFVVLMQPEDASQVVCGSGNIHARCLLPGTLEPVIRRQPPSGWLKNVLRQSALAQYLNTQLKLKPAKLAEPRFWRTGAPAEKKPAPAARPSGERVPPAPELVAIMDRALALYFQQTEPLQGARTVFVIDMNRSNLKPGVNVADEGVHVAQRLRERAQVVVQGEPLYRAHQQRSTLRLDMGPHDQHLNRIGVGLLMEAAAVAMQSKPTQEEGH